MYRQIILTLMILMLIISCGTKKSMIKSKLENNIETQIDDSTQIKTSSKTTTETTDTTNITIQETIEETTTDTSKHQTTKRIINRRTTVNKAGNTITKQSENTDIKETTHKVIKEQKKEDNQTRTVKESPFKLTYDYIIIICLLILFSVYLYKLKKK